MRLKIIAGNLAVVLLLGVAAYIMVGGTLRAELLGQLEGRIASDRELFERSFRLAARDFVELVADRAAARESRDIFAGLDLDSRRTRAFEVAEATAAWLANPARGVRGGPDIVVVVDDSGKAIARNGARNVMFGKQLSGQIPALEGALKSGRPAHDIWLEDREKKILETAIAPVRSQSGAILGALVVGYDLSNGVASREAEVLGRDVAFLAEGNVYSSSLGGTAARDLKGYLFGPQAAATNAVLGAERGASPMWTAELSGQKWSGITARLPNDASHPVAFAVLGNRSAQVSMASRVNVILVLTALGAILIVLYGFVIGNALMRPIEQIEEGVLAVINGRTDLRLETESEHLGGLAFRINQLLNVFTGTAEDTDDDGRSSVASVPAPAHWKDAAYSDAAGGTGQAPTNPDEPIDDPQLAAALARESEAAYGARIYREYVDAKRALGEEVSNIPEDRFAQRLTGRASALASKHGCRLVRFKVETAGDQVILRPVLIR
ncbi:MAG: hypothetical protein OEZ06_18370 [Myxococcales bacterium]|nr:hypothetical protein [Myxococcales bacterium]